MEKNHWYSKISEKITVTDITLWAVASLLVTVLFTEQVWEQIFPPQPEIHVTNFNAEHGVVTGTFPNYVYSPRSFPDTGKINEIFHLTIINNNDAVANNFSILFSWSPKQIWLNYSDTKVSNPALSSVCPKKSNHCFFESVSKQLGPIQLSYNVTFDINEFKKINTTNPQIHFTYKFDEIPKSETITINVEID